MASTAIASPQTLSGPGYLYWAPGGSAEPTHASTASAFSDLISTPWINLGPTAEGTTFGYNVTQEAIRVAEFFDPVKMVTTERSGTISANLASVTLSNLKKVLNGGTITTTGSGATSINKYTPPAPGSETRCMVMWESDDATVRLIGYQVINSAELSLAMAKAPAYATLNVSFNLEKPTAGGEPFAIITAGAARA